MIDKLISVNSRWIDNDTERATRCIIVREIISEDGELWIKYSSHAQDTIYGSTYDAFLKRFKQAGNNEI